MLTLVVAIVSMGILPVLVNKSTEHGRFDFIHPYLREIWTGLFVFYSWYVIHSNSGHPILMWLHANTKPWLAYLLMAIIGSSLFCGYYWFAGKVFHSPAQTTNDPPPNGNPSPSQNSYAFREKASDEVVFNFGNNFIVMPRTLLAKGPQPIPLELQLGDPLFNSISMYLKDGKPFVDVKMWGGGGERGDQYEVELVHNEFSVRPREWDRNFNDEAFEVIDGTGRPILQVYYKTANEIVINGVFRSLLHMVYASDESGVETRLIPQREGTKPTPPPLKRMFRYPSIKHKGEFSPDWPIPIAGDRDHALEAAKTLESINKLLDDLKHKPATSLRKRTLDLSKRILVFADRRRRNEPIQPASPAKSESDKLAWKKWEEYAMEGRRLYIKDFSPEVIAITTELKSRGVSGGAVDFLHYYGHGRYKVVANLVVIEDIAQHLAIAAGQLKEP